MEQKLKEAEEMHVMLQQECEKYKVVLAETVGVCPVKFTHTPPPIFLWVFGN